MSSNDEKRWRGVGIACAMALLPVGFSVFVAPEFAHMFEEFGATTALPLRTRLALAPWAGPAIALLAILPLVVAAVRGKAPPVNLCLLLVAAGLVGLVYGTYLPIYPQNGGNV